ncbi:MAG: hypothetical protein IJP22_02250 [Clostridia bacterium]|nr:hypothetical protein [Clostridia bacterium]
MKYKKIIKQIAIKEKTTVSEVEAEMLKALKAAGINCTPKEFIMMTTKGIKDYI